MNNPRVYELVDCAEFRQTLLAQPPTMVRATVILLTSLVAIAIIWAGFTEVDLVVRAPGRVRPMIQTSLRPDAAAEESHVAPLATGRVVEVHVKEGDQVRQGDVLVQLDTVRLESDIARQQHSIQTSQDELRKLDLSETMLIQRFQLANSKAEAELAHAQELLESAKQQRLAAIGLAQVALELTADDLRRFQELAVTQAVSESERVQAEGRWREAKLKLLQVQLPVDEGRLLILRRSLQLVDKEHAIERSELDSKRQQKSNEIVASGIALANLQWERQQAALRAPSDGKVTSLAVAVGDIIESGKSALAIVEQRGFRIDLEVASKDVGLLREGMPVRIKMDAYDYQKYGTVTGRVYSVSADSQVLSYAKAPQGSTYVVKIMLEDDLVSRGSHRGRIKLGMTGVAEIITDRECILSLLVRSIRQSISLG